MLHSGQVLNSPGNAHGNIELTGARRLAGLSDLAALGQPTRVRNGSRAAERCADRIRQFPELSSLGFLADSAADGQNELGRAHVDVVSGTQFDEIAGRRAARHPRSSKRGEPRRRPLFRRLEHIAPYGEQHAAEAGKADFDVYFLAVAAARGYELAVDALHLEDIGREAQLEFGRQSCRVAE